MNVCSQRLPALLEPELGHHCACHLYDDSLSDDERKPAIARAIEAADKAVRAANLTNALG